MLLSSLTVVATQNYALGPTVAVVLLAFVLTNQAGAAVSCDVTETGNLLVPTLRHEPPMFASPEVSQATKSAYFVTDPISGQKFRLHAAASQTSVCVASDCVFFADFNVAWYASNDVLLFDSDDPGDEIGHSVPSTASYGVVYLVSGPDTSTSDGVDSRFNLLMGCDA